MFYRSCRGISMTNKQRRLNIIDKLKYGRYFINVRDSIISGQYERAMDVLDKMYNIYGENKPSRNVQIQLNLIYGMVCWNLNRYDDVYRACEAALDQIGSKLIKEIDKKKINELRYFRGYCKTLIGFTDANGGMRSDFDFRKVDELLTPDYDVDKISSFLKRSFPIDDVSWWN